VKSHLLALFFAAACDKSSPATATQTPASTPTPAATATAPAEITGAAAPAASVASPYVDAIIAQHVLVIYKGAKRAPKGVTRDRADAKARAEEALAKIRSGTAFEEIVKAYSDDSGSVDRMGSVGKFRREAMDPAFSAAAFALKVGEVSDVVQTPFGYHVIKRTQ
jgi:PPIC-type peptidyl-prolyl cis-trans isomerase-like protein